LPSVPFFNGKKPIAFPSSYNSPIGFFMIGNFGVDSGEGRVADGIGLLDIGRDILAGFCEVGVQRLGELEGFVVGGYCEVEGFGTVGVGFEGANAVGDNGIGEEVLVLVSLGMSSGWHKL
jgi:hypothetical protein